MKLFENSVGRPSNEIKKKRKIFVGSAIATFLVILIVGSYILQNINLVKLEGASTTENDSIDRQQRAVLEVAKANMAQGK